MKLTPEIFALFILGILHLVTLASHARERRDLYNRIMAGGLKELKEAEQGAPKPPGPGSFIRKQMTDAQRQMDLHLGGSSDE